MTPIDQALKQLARKYEQQIEEMRSEHAAVVEEVRAGQRGALRGLEHQVWRGGAGTPSTGGGEGSLKHCGRKSKEQGYEG